MHVHLCVLSWLFSLHPSPSSTLFRCSPSGPSRCLPQSSTRGSGPTPCATSAWGPWPLLTTRHPSQLSNACSCHPLVLDRLRYPGYLGEEGTFSAIGSELIIGRLNLTITGLTPCLSQGLYIMIVVIFMTHASPRRRQLPPAFSFGITEQHQCSVNVYGYLMSSVRVDPKAITSDILYGNRKIELRCPVATDSHLLFSLGDEAFPRERSWTPLSSPALRTQRSVSSSHSQWVQLKQRHVGEHARVGS